MLMHAKRLRTVFSLIMVMGLLFLSTPAAAAEIWDGTATAPDAANGDGTENNPFQISNGSELAWMAQVINDGTYNNADTYFILTSDIMLNPEGELSAASRAWTSIGAYTGAASEGFYGHFDGQGHTISGLYLYTENAESISSYQGLFGWVRYSATIQDLHLAGYTLVAGSLGNLENSSGALVGVNDGAISNISNQGIISITAASGTNHSNVGGLIGKNSDTITDISNSGSIILANISNISASQTYFSTGGLIGKNEKMVYDIENSGTITFANNGSGSENYNGGLIGSNYEKNSSANEIIVIGASNSGTIIIADTIQNIDYLGGLIGLNRGYLHNATNTAAITNSITNGGVFRIGGIVGSNNRGHIINAYNTARLSNADTGSLGGIAARSEQGTIINAYNTGKIMATGTDIDGAIVGNASFSTVEYVYWLDDPDIEHPFGSLYTTTPESYTSFDSSLNLAETITVNGTTANSLLDALIERTREYNLTNLDYLLPTWLADSDNSNGGFPKLGEVEDYYDVWVNGMRVHSGNQDDVLAENDADPSVIYTPANGNNPAKLTLNNATINQGRDQSGGIVTFGAMEVTDVSAAIWAEEDLIIELIGENTVDSPTKEDHHIVGIYLPKGNLTIEGSGSLDISSDDVSASYYGYEGMRSAAIFVLPGSITIESGTINASAGVGDYDTDYYQGISAGIMSINGGIIINGGTIKATATTADTSYGIGIAGMPPVSITINGGELIVSTTVDDNYTIIKKLLSTLPSINGDNITKISLSTNSDGSEATTAAALTETILDDSSYNYLRIQNLSAAQCLAADKALIETALANLTLSNTSTAADILTAANNAAIYGTTISWDSNAGFDLTEATPESAGSIGGTLNLELNSENDSLPLELSIDKLTVTTLSIESNPNQTAYKFGESLITTGLVVKATLSDGSIIDSVPLANLTISDISTFNVGNNQLVTISYGGQAASFNVDINRHQQDPQITNTSTLQISATKDLSSLITGVADNATLSFNIIEDIGTNSSLNGSIFNAGSNPGQVKIGITIAQTANYDEYISPPADYIMINIIAQTTDNNISKNPSQSEQQEAEELPEPPEYSETMLELSPTIDGDNLSAELTQEQLAEIVATALATAKDTANPPKLIINLDTAEQVSSLELNLTNDALADLAANEGAQLKINSPAGSLTFDQTSLAAISGGEAGAQIKIVLRKVNEAAELSFEQQQIVGQNPVYELYVEINGIRVTDFNYGLVTVEVPEELPLTATSTVTVYFVAADGSIEAVATSYNPQTRTVTFSTDHFSYYVITISDSEQKDPRELPFVDIKADDWFYQDVQFVYAEQIMAGLSATVFAPNEPVSRAMMAQVIWNMEGQPLSAAANPFKDIKAEDWYYQAITWAAEQDIYRGISADTFAAEQAITREQLAAVLYRYAAFKGYDLSKQADLSSFADAVQIASWAYDNMVWAVGNGLIQGKAADSLDPTGIALRAEIAAILHRFSSNY